MPRKKTDEPEIPVYGEDGGILPAPLDEWPEYRKRVTTRAVRVEGPFEVLTSEGPLTCQDGYLAIDARGYLYPIAAEEFALIYEPVKAADAEAAAIGELMAEHDIDESQAAARLGV